VKLVEFNLEVCGHGRKNLSVSTSCSNLQWLKNLRAWLDVDELSRLYAERWTVNKLTIDEDVTVHNQLTSLSGGTCETCTEYECVKTHFEELYQVFTGQTLGLASFLEDVAQLCFADTVLSA
jgi:uncharacterized protein YecA (UPF0149 family)